MIDDPEEVDIKKALLEDPIVGTDMVVLDEHGPGALQPSPLPSPRPMAEKPKVLHDIAHLPYDPGCPMCVSTRRPNSGHCQSHEYLRVIPMLVADDSFMRFANDSDLQTVLVMRLYHYKPLFRLRCPQEWGFTFG